MDIDMKDKATVQKYITFLESEIKRLEAIVQWKKIQDELPSVGQYVLALCKGKLMPRVLMYSKAGFVDAYFVGYPSVIEWMPLPDKEEG